MFLEPPDFFRTTELIKFSRQLIDARKKNWLSGAKTVIR